MSYITKLKLVTGKRERNVSPIILRRGKLATKIEEQLMLATAKKEGRVYAPKRIKKMTNEGVSGSYRSSEGIKDDAVWSTRAKWMDLLYRAMNFAGLAFILVFFLKKPFADGLSSRRDGIKDQLEALESRKAEAEQMYKEAEAKLARLDELGNIVISMKTPACLLESIPNHN